MRYQQPRSGGVAKGKPITRGLVFANSGAGTANALNSRVGTIVSGPISSAVGRYGVANSMNAAEGFRGATSIVKSAGFDCTLFVVFKSSNLAGGDDRLLSIGDSASDGGFSMRMTSSGDIGVVKGIVLDIPLTGSTSLVVSKWYAIAITYKHATGAIVCYIQDLETGVFRVDGTGTNTSAWAGDGADTNWTVLVKEFNGNLGRHGDYGPSATFSRQLSAFEARSLCDNPWQLFAPERAIRSIVGTGGPAAYTLTASAGSYALTGAAAILTFVGLPGTAIYPPIAGLPMLGALGSNAAPGTNYTLTAAAGAYALTGLAANLVYTPIGGTIYTISPSGGIVFSGAVSIAHTRVVTTSGTIVFSGQGSITHTRAILPSGTLTFTGASVISKTRVMSPTGTLVFSGTAPIINPAAPTVSGTIRTLTGMGL